jgi:hypothetical protein
MTEPGRLAIRPTWPKRRPCLWCGRPRRTAAPSDRFHLHCRVAVAGRAQGLPASARWPSKRTWREVLTRDG